MKVFGSITRLFKLLFREDGYDITFQPDAATTYTANRTITLPPGDADKTLVSTSGAQNISTTGTIEAASVTGTSYMLIQGITTAQRDALTPSAGTLVYNTTVGGLQEYTASGWKTVLAGTISNADVASNAAIDGSKVNPNFGSQAIQTGSDISGRAISVNGTGTNGRITLYAQTGDVSTFGSGLALYAKNDNKLYIKFPDGSVSAVLTAATNNILPSYTTTQRDALTPSAGMVIYNSTDNRFQGYVTSTGWVNLHGWGA